MKRKVVSTLFMGSIVKLTPQGKLYKLTGVSQRLGKVYLTDEDGKEKAVAMGTDVYCDIDETLYNRKW